MADPCSITTTASMAFLHQVIAGVGLLSLGANIFMVKLMWGDFKKKHHINGKDRD